MYKTFFQGISPISITDVRVNEVNDLFVSFYTYSTDNNFKTARESNFEVKDSMNEFERFAWAYLIMKGMLMDKEGVENIKNTRVLSLLNKEDSVEFLTKDINAEYIKFLSELIRGEIHRQSGLPNLDDYKFGGGTSG